MTTLIIISSYIISIFVSRKCNKLLYEIGEAVILPVVWFLPFINIFMFGLMVFFEMEEIWNHDSSKNNWFTGKNWKQKE